MKNKKFLIFIFIIITVLTFVLYQPGFKNSINKIPDYNFENVYKKINLKNAKDKNTVKIFCESLIFEYYYDCSKDELEEKHIKPEYMNAVEVDLDDDNVNEIIGSFNLLFDEPKSSESFYVLKKIKGKYKCIYSFSFSIEKPISILKSKTNNMHDIGFIGAEFWHYKPIIVKFDGKNYEMDSRILYKTKNEGGKVLENVQFNTEKDKKAQDIFFEFILDKYEEYAKDFPEVFQKNRMMAHYFDLNEDGEPEILGFGDSTFFGTMRELDLYILQKQNGKYVDIAEGCIFFIPEKVEILEDKINNYHRIKYYRLGGGYPRSNAPIIPNVAGYENGRFCYHYEL